MNRGALFLFHLFIFVGSTQLNGEELVSINIQKSFPQINLNETSRFLRLLDLHTKYLQENKVFLRSKSTSSTFDCDVYGPSPSVPESVHKLRPGDIKVVAALGDSLTAAFGAKAKSIFSVFTEYRGVSFSIGGDSSIDDTVTIPNILKKYNPQIYGFSTGKGGVDAVNSKFNRAITGAVSSELIGEAEDLVYKMKADSKVNINTDWKLVTLWIGGNDLCDYCDDPNQFSADNYVDNIRKSLRILKSALPRLFVNLLLGIDVTKLYEVTGGLCSLLHSYECSCGTSSDKKVRDQVSKALLEYNEKLVLMSQEEEFRNSDDFTVVVQPFLENTEVPRENGKPDLAYFAPDCFHFSQLGHEAAAVALWNNMIEQEGHKRDKWIIGEPIECPQEDVNPFLCTYKNDCK